MSCSNSPIDCFASRCLKDQLVCFNQNLTVAERCHEQLRDERGTENNCHCSKCNPHKRPRAHQYFTNPFKHHVNAFIFNGTVTLTNDSTSCCSITYEVIDCNGKKFYEVKPGTSHAIVVENLKEISVVREGRDNWDSVATGEILLQLFYILKLSCS